MGGMLTWLTANSCRRNTINQVLGMYMIRGQMLLPAHNNKRYKLVYVGSRSFPHFLVWMSCITSRATSHFLRGGIIVTKSVTRSRKIFAVASNIQIDKDLLARRAYYFFWRLESFSETSLL